MATLEKLTVLLFKPSGTWITPFIVMAIITWLGQQPSLGQSPASTQWWKGNLHTHSLWSDGDDFPEMIVDWYAQRDYNFLVLSDHNILSVGERWMSNREIISRGGEAALEKYRQRFGQDWVESRVKESGNKKPEGNRPTAANAAAANAAAGEKASEETNQQQAQTPPATAEWETRLKPLSEFRGKFEVEGKFLLMQAEEITDRVGKLPVHMNASNLPELVQPQGGASVREAIVNNLRAVNDVAERHGQKVLVHLNHPNFGWAITPEDLAYVAEEQFFEIYNGHPAVNQLGDEYRPSLELMWDIANTLRIDQFKTSPLYGLGTDDCHNYHGTAGSRPGRGWIQVRSKSLRPDDLITSMKRGDFYASTGVKLNDIQFDAKKKVLRIEIVGEPGVEYTTRIVGTPRDYDRTWPAGVDADGKQLTVKQRYCSKIGTVFAEVPGTSVEYQLTGNELFVRAVVTSSRLHPDPSFPEQREQAWTQPCGW